MSSSDSERADDPAVLQKPRRKRKLVFNPKESAGRASETMENNGGGCRSDVSVDDSDKDPDFVLQDADDESDSRLVIDSTLSSPDSSFVSPKPLLSRKPRQSKLPLSVPIASTSVPHGDDSSPGPSRPVAASTPLPSTSGTRGVQRT
ncbi:Hypothetical protein FKW44_013481, partial [Caligus rogercresseyi]